MPAKWVSLCALGLSLGLLASPATAARFGDMNMQVGTTQPGAEAVAYRRCWWADGRRHCRRIVSRHYDGGYGYDSYGYGPGIGLYFGGGRGHGHGRGHR
jgi:hypothetical protein